LLLLAFLVNSVVALQVVRDYTLLDKWLADPAPTPNSEIPALQRQVLLRVVSRLVVSAVLILSALVFVWQRRRNLTMHGELNRVRRLAHEVLESMVQGVIVVDDRRTIVNINPAGIRLLDPGAEERSALVGHPLAELPSAGAGLAQLVDEVNRRGEPVWDRDLAVERVGLTRRLRVDAQSLRDASGHSFGCIILLRDMTMRLLTEERMGRMERIAGLGDAATGLVHEIKNPLTALCIHIELLEEQLADPAATEPLGPLIREVKTEADRLNHLLDGFWDYAQLRSLDMQPTDAVAVLERIVHLIRPEAGRQGVRVELRRPAARLPAVPLDPEKFEEAVWNLATNALEAMPAGGALVIDVAVQDGTLSVVVCDTGSGIPPEIQSEIFKPYFSTKSRGTGLGLALTEKLVGQHRGEIECRTGPGGTSFHLAFPLDDGARSCRDDGREPLPDPDRG
jgi:nitrogen-specific signal transduction histidine kinase